MVSPCNRMDKSHHREPRSAPAYSQRAVWEWLTRSSAASTSRWSGAPSLPGPELTLGAPARSGDCLYGSELASVFALGSGWAGADAGSGIDLHPNLPKVPLPVELVDLDLEVEGTEIHAIRSIVHEQGSPRPRFVSLPRSRRDPLQQTRSGAWCRSEHLPAAIAS